ncbi:MAG TPA: ABC transporter permease [Pirellulaceae bacterium]|nr:ABC transporter permease [Pirellulaceae bacterium]
MNVLTLALKDLKLILRDKLGAFFILGFPVLMGVFFGLVMGGSPGSGGGTMKVAIVDQDQSPWSEKLIDELRKNPHIDIEFDELPAARNSVPLGRRVAVVVIPPDFGQSAGILWEPQPEIQVGLDPSRGAESAMLEGYLMQASGALIADRFRQPTQFVPHIERIREDLQAGIPDSAALQLLDEFLGQVTEMIDSADRWQQADEAAGDNQAFDMQFANIKRHDISQDEDPASPRAQLKKLRSRWDISFPQGMMWGILGCVAGFAGSIAREDARGTLVRLRAAPLTKWEILLGKALACLLACCLVIGLLTTIGTFLGMRGDDYGKLFVAALAVSLAFVGIMMTMSVLGRTEESVNGSGWAINMVMAMLGGGMIPAMFMPGFLQALSGFSPVFWAIRLIEGAIWRQFTWSEMLVPIGILLAVGGAGVVVGTSILMRRYR